MKAAELPPGCVKTQADVATAFGMKPSGVAYWARCGMPHREGGGYDLIAIERWRAKRERTRAAAKRSLSGGEVDEEGARSDPLVQWEQRKRELELRTMEAAVRKVEEQAISIDDVRDLLRSRMSALRQAHLTLPQRVLPRLREIQAEEGGWSNTRMRQALEEELSQILTDYLAEVRA